MVDAIRTFNLASANNRPLGIASSDTDLFVSDNNRSVYRYRKSDGRLLGSFIISRGRGEGIVFANNLLYLIIGRVIESFTIDGTSRGTFALNGANTNASGIAASDDRFFVVDHSDDKVYVYTHAGVYQPGEDFDLLSANDNPNGITASHNRLYVPDLSDDKVYAYTHAGVHQPGEDFDLDSENSNPYGITLSQNIFYVVDQQFQPRTRFRIFLYDSNAPTPISVEFRAGIPSFSVGELREPPQLLSGLTPFRSGSPLFDAILTPRQGNFPTTALRRPEGIDLYQQKAWIPDSVEGKMFVYDLLGRQLPGDEFLLDNENSAPRGIAIDPAAGLAFVPDDNSLNMFAYNLSDGTWNQSRSFDLASTNRDPSGASLLGGTIHVSDLVQRSIYKYSASNGVAQGIDSIPSGISPRGMSVQADATYFTDASQGKILKVEGGIVLAENLFNVELERTNRLPSGLSVSNFRGFVCDEEADTIFVYDFRAGPRVVEFGSDSIGDFRAGSPRLELGELRSALPPGPEPQPAGPWLPWPHYGSTTSAAIVTALPDTAFNVRIRALREGAENPSAWLEVQGLRTKPAPE